MTNSEDDSSVQEADVANLGEAYFLDTNAYALLLRGIPEDATNRLRARLSKGAYCEAAISELTSLEIHSVVGQLARGQSGGLHFCERSIEAQGGIMRCPQRWSQPARKGLRPLEVDRVRKAIRDAEGGHGPIRLKVVQATERDFVLGRDFLYAHAGQWRFGSHDAIIASAAVRYSRVRTCRLVTSDRGLKSLLKAIMQRFYDPLVDEDWSP